MSGSAVAQEWTRRLDADGAVDFERSWGKVALHALGILAFIVSGVAMIAFGDGDAAPSIGGVIVVAVFASFLLMLVVQVTAPGHVLRVERRGMTVGYRTPLKIPWERVMGVWVHKANRIASATVAVDTSDRTLDEYARQASPWARLWRLQLIGPLRNTVMIGLLAAPADELAAWLDTQVDIHADVPSKLVLFPVEGSSPVRGGPRLRSVDVSRLRISHTLSEVLTDWGRRAAPSVGRHLNGDEPDAAWASLAEEGRRLGVHLQQELGAGAVVHWFEDRHDGEGPAS
ncbi:MAG: hypothetical protein H0X12_02490 [Nocardioides sp.]|nr:hypothetical protein [Nocardioides sp.]